MKKVFYTHAIYVYNYAWWSMTGNCDWVLGKFTSLEKAEEALLIHQENEHLNKFKMGIEEL